MRICHDGRWPVWLVWWRSRCTTRLVLSDRCAFLLALSVTWLHSYTVCLDYGERLTSVLGSTAVSLCMCRLSGCVSAAVRPGEPQLWKAGNSTMIPTWPQVISDPNVTLIMNVLVPVCKCTHTSHDDLKNLFIPRHQPRVFVMQLALRQN